MAGIKGHYIYDTDGNIIGATGAKLAALTNKKEHGEDFYKVNGRLGGAVKGVKKGFATNVEVAKRAGALGGRNSKRRWTPEEKERHSKRMKDVWRIKNEVR